MGWVKIFFLLLFIWASCTGTYINGGYYSDEEIISNGLLDFIVFTVISMIVPFVCRIVNKEKFDFEQGKKICKWNSIGVLAFWFIIDIINYGGLYDEIFENMGANIIYIIVFYFVNKILFVEDKTVLHNSSNNNSSAFKCSNCGFEVNENDKYCRNCFMTFDDDIDDNEKLFKCDNCGALVRESDAYCPKCGEIFEDDEEINEIKCSNCDAIIPNNVKKCPNCLLPIESIEDVIEKEENNTEADYNDAISEYKKGNLNKAEEIFKQYIKQNEIKDDDKENNIIDFNNHAEFIIYAERFNKGEKVQYITTNISNSYLYLGMIEFDRKNYDDSIKYLNKSIKNNPMNTMAMFEKVEAYKAKNDLEKYYNESKKIFKYIYNSSDLAHYYRNLGYYYIEKKEWRIAKALYLYSVTKEMSDTASHEIAYICEKSNDNNLIEINEVKEILEDNRVPLTLSEENIKIINKLYDS